MVLGLINGRSKIIKEIICKCDNNLVAMLIITNKIVINDEQ
jgi:hypothetical protein